MSDQKKKKPDPDIVYQGKAITLPGDPEKMSIPDAIEALERKAKDEAMEMDVHEQIMHHPFDALVAFNWAMKEIYGWASPQPTPGFFGPKAPDMITVPTGPKKNDFVQVPSGSFKLPNVSKPIQTHLDFRGNCLHIMGKVRKRDREFLVELVNTARNYLETNSIFRAKAFRLPVDDDGDASFSNVSFIETDYIQPSDLVLNDDELAQVEASLWTPIKFTEECVKNKVPLNRGVLLEGIYGTGKTMTAHVTSKVCIDNGWTYILLDDVRALKECLLFAQRYQPCVIFAEDIDRVAEERDQRGNDILNTIDGVLTKNSQVITVLTTNHVEKLDRAMLRPGRLDAVISVRPPEGDTVRRLIRLYGRELVDPKDPLNNAVEVLAGNIPATIREVVERSKLAMISRGGKSITDADLLTTAKTMTRHLALLNTKKPEMNVYERAGRAISDLVNTEELEEELDAAGNNIARQANRFSDDARRIQQAISNTNDKLSEVLEDTNTIREAIC